MLKPSELKAILEEAGESDILDFKAEPYRFDTLDAQGKFIKDIVSMFNTPREESAYIIIGVKHDPTDNSRELLGVVEHLDDSDLHDQINDGRVEPSPSFIYQPIQVDGLIYGVIEIRVQKSGGPSYPKKQFGKRIILPDKLYFREGTKNVEANSSSRDRILKWFYGTEKAADTSNELVAPSVSRWDEFFAASHHFESNRHFVLILGPQTLTDYQWQPLSKLPISLVVDFDPKSEEQGIYSHVAQEMKQHRAVHLWTKGNITSMIPERACYWFAARGIEGREATIERGDWRAWNQKYAREIIKLFEEFVDSADGKPITVISLWDAQQYVRTIFQQIDAVAGNMTDYVVATETAHDYSSLEQDFDATVIQISEVQLLVGIDENLSRSDQVRLPASVPTYSGSPYVISQEILHWLSEDLEVLHSSIEREGDDSDVVGVNFLKGEEINWRALNNHFDADRRKTSDLTRIVEDHLRLRKTVRLNLYHWPGSGGTTIARRLAWDYRNKYPVALLKRASDETIGRLRNLFSNTNQSILVIVEAADILDDDRERLFLASRTENIACVFVNVVRRFDVPSSTDRSLFLDQRLDDQESYRFVEAYKRVVPERKLVLEQVLNGPSRERTPFHFALQAFGRDYQGLKRYVESRLRNGIATPQQQQLLAFIALAYYYGHKPIQAQLFTSLLGVPKSRVLHLESYLGNIQKELLVKNNDGTWRPAHQLIAEQILESVLSGFNSPDYDWRRNISSWSRNFIDLCSSSSQIPHRNLIDLLRRVFILRDEAELLGTESSASSKFSRIIEDIPTDEGRLSVFNKLTEAFPGEAHFWGHLGRFHSSVDNPELAIGAIEKALQITPQDATLHHMHGMALRTIVYRLMRTGSHRDDFDVDSKTRTTWQDIRPFVERALNAFATARKLDPNSEHGYISPVQMLIRIVDFGYKESKINSRAAFLASKTPLSAWCRELLDEAENLMDGIRQAREGDSLSNFYRDSDAKIAEVYGDYNVAIQGWNNLLAQPDIHASPIRRQIARAYLGQSNNNWRVLKSSNIERIIDLMELNLREEPSSEASLRIWFRAIRYSGRDYTDIALDRLASWRAMGDAIDAYFYLYILHVLKAMDGHSIERLRSEELIQQCRTRARNQRNRTRSHEWFGQGQGLSRLIHSFDLGEWDTDSGFYRNTGLLLRVNGRVQRISAPEAGLVELSDSGLYAFFVPAVAGLEKGRDENRRISFLLGFSYDGMRAWSVETVE